MIDEQALIDAVLKREGGYVNHPEDRGGATNFGITQHTLENFLGRPVTKHEVEELDVVTATEIYRGKYLYAPHINKLDGRLVPQIFDCCVNHGARRAIKFLQVVVNNYSSHDLKVDGYLGKRSLTASTQLLSMLTTRLVNKKICAERINFYYAIVDRDPKQIIFLKGWLKRANEFNGEPR